MNEIKQAEKNLWVIYHNGNNVFHMVPVEKGQQSTSGLPFMEMFENKDEAKQRMLELNPDWVDSGE